MEKSPPKHLGNQSNPRTRIQRYVKVKHPKNTQQQSSWKMEAMEVNSIMEKLDESDGNRHIIKTKINHFGLIFESDDEEGTNNKTKPKTPIIILSEDEKRKKNKLDQNKGNKEDEDDR